MEEVRMHLAYRWFSRLGFELRIPGHGDQWLRAIVITIPG